MLTNLLQHHVYGLLDMFKVELFEEQLGLDLEVLAVVAVAGVGGGIGEVAEAAGFPGSKKEAVGAMENLVLGGSIFQSLER